MEQYKRDQYWDLAGLARMDGDHKEAQRYMNLARGLPPETVRKGCWTCVGNGVTKYPGCAIETCVDCQGKGYVVS